MSRIDFAIAVSSITILASIILLHHILADYSISKFKPFDRYENNTKNPNSKNKNKQLSIVLSFLYLTASRSKLQVTQHCYKTV
jgi:hypothetical protein